MQKNKNALIPILFIMSRKSYNKNKSKSDNLNSKESSNHQLYSSYTNNQHPSSSRLTFKVPIPELPETCWPSAELVSLADPHRQDVHQWITIFEKTKWTATGMKPQR